MMSSPAGGTRTFSSLSEAASRTADVTFTLTPGLREDERNDEADEGEGLDQGEADQHVPEGNLLGLGLTGDGLHAETEDDADADTGADGGKAVGDRTEAAADVVLGGEDQCRVHGTFLILPGTGTHRCEWRVSEKLRNARPTPARSAGAARDPRGCAPRRGHRRRGRPAPHRCKRPSAR